MQNQNTVLSARFGSSQITSPPTAASGFTTSDRGCCNIVAALVSYSASPKAQPFDLSMVENAVAYTGCARNEAFESLMQSGGDMPRACEKARRCVSSGCLAALGDAKLVTPYVTTEFENGGKSSLLLYTGNSAGLVITKALYLLRLKHLSLERASSKLVDTLGASPPVVLGEATFEAFVLTGRRGHLRLRAQVVPALPGASGYTSMREINVMGASILMARK